MQLHTLSPKNKKKKARRVGRGGKRGSFSGRGIKGQKSRSGRRIRPEMRDLIQKIPKKRGYKQTMPMKMSVALKASLVAKYFKKGDIVTPQALIKKRLVRHLKGKIPSVKIVSAGSYLSDLVIKDCKVSGKS